MEKQIQLEPRWEGKVSAKLPNAKADKIWSFFQDFFGLGKWFPGITTCYGVHGNNGEPGSIRYAAGEVKLPVEGGGGEMLTMTSWAKERLISIDKDHKCLTYDFVDNNFGFQNYVGNFKVVPADEDGGGCVIEWRVSVDPVPGLTYEKWISNYEAWLSGMAEKMAKEALNEN